MIYTVENPVGIDARIDALQTHLHAYLLAKWGITTDQYDCYGRAYRNRRDYGYIPEKFKRGANDKDYKDVLFDNSKVVTSFFGTGTETSMDGKMATIDVHAVFFTNLSVIKSALAHRGDEEARLDVMEFFRRGRYGFELTGQKTGVESVLSEYPGKAKDDMLAKCDIHPWHTFRFDLRCTYDPLGNV